MVICPEYSFVQFSDRIDDCCCSIPLEVAEASDLSFHVFSDVNIKLFICNLSGDTIAEIGDIASGWITPDIDLSEYLACGDCFRLMILSSDPLIPIAQIKNYSNLFLYDKDTDNPLIRYRSNNTAFFPFKDGIFNSIRLPLEITNRNPRTETEEYIDANGRISNPYKTRRGVYDLNVDYMPVSFHDKIQVMLMHDVFIDDTEINETGDYQINYEEYVFENNIYLYQAATEVSMQEILMMRNY